MPNAAYSGRGPSPLCRIIRLRLAIFILRSSRHMHAVAQRIIKREGGRNG